MPKFLFKASYSTDGVKGVADKGGSARRDAVESLFEASGGKMEGFYFGLGETDAYVFGDLPDIESATAVALTVNQSGLASVTTVALLTPEQVDEASKASVEYRPPGS